MIIATNVANCVVVVTIPPMSQVPATHMPVVSHETPYLASDEARFVTGLQMKIDAGLVGR